MSSGFEKRFDLGWLRLTTNATQQGGFFRGDLIGKYKKLVCLRNGEKYGHFVRVNIAFEKNNNQ